MTWNHRVVRRTWRKGEVDEEKEYAIHEAYYGRDDDGGISITADHKAPYGETVEELRETLQRMLRALDRPVLDYDTREEILRRQHGKPSSKESTGPNEA